MLTEKELTVLRRRAQGESQDAVARALKVSQAAISKFETNAKRKILESEEVLRLAEGLGIRTEESGAGRRVAYRGATKGGAR